MSLRKIGFVAAAFAIAAAACSKEPDPNRELTQHEKDSILGASTVPGAKAVKRALTSADSAAARGARLERLDSSEREP